MTETTINQRLKFLMDALGLKAGTFSRALGISETNVRNYTDRTSKPGFDTLERIATTFKQVNLAWLITGEGEHFLPMATPINTNTAHINNNSGIGINTGTVTLEACQRELEAMKRDAASYQREIELLKGQLEDKSEIITLLRGSHNRPN